MSYDPTKDPLAMLNDKQVAKILNREVSAVKRDRREGRGVSFIRINRNTVRYRRCDVEKFIEDNLVTPASK